jgi:hypothetical protein
MIIPYINMHIIISQKCCLPIKCRRPTHYCAVGLAIVFFLAILGCSSVYTEIFLS